MMTTVLDNGFKVYLEDGMYRLGIPAPIPFEHPSYQRSGLWVARDPEDTGPLLGPDDIADFTGLSEVFYAADGYVYDGPEKTTRLRKWYVACELRQARKHVVTFWLPILTDVRQLEQHRWTEVQALDKCYAKQGELWTIARRINEQGDPVYAPILDRESEDHATHEIYMDWHFDERLGGFGHIERCLYPGESKKHDRHQELGDELANLSMQIKTHGMRRAAFGGLLDDKLQQNLPDPTKRSSTGQARIDVNGRHYWYWIATEKGWQHWAYLSWPESDVEIVTL